MMNIFFELAVNLFEIYLIFDFLIKYFEFKAIGKMSRVGSFLFFTISFLSLSYFTWNYVYEIFAIILQIALNLIFCEVCLKGSHFHKAFISVFLMGTVSLIATLVLFMFGHIAGRDPIEILAEFNYVRVIAVLLSKMILFYVLKIILSNKNNYGLNKRDFFSLWLSPIISIILIAIITVSAISFPDIQRTAFIVVLLVCILNILTYYLFIQLAKSNELKLQYELLKLQYSCSIENTKQVKSLYEQISSVRHDLNNHLNCINILVKENKYSEIGLYIDRLMKKQADINRPLVFSENDILDSILNIKFNDAAKLDIKCNIYLTYNLKSISGEDICVLFSNLLDNAIRACNGISNAFINVDIQMLNSYISILVSNSIEESVLKGNPELKTTKIDSSYHGFGIYNIKKTVRKYNGILKFYEENNRFICSILIPV